MAIEIVDFPINSTVIFQFAMLVYQRVSMTCLAFAQIRSATCHVPSVPSVPRHGIRVARQEAGRNWDG